MDAMLLHRIRQLNLPLGEYALFGSAHICMRGLRQCRDIDIIVTEDLWNKYKDKKGWEVKIMDNGSACLSSDEVELWKDWKPGVWNINDLIKNSEIIEGLPFVRLEEVIKWKKLNGREKDLLDLKLIEKFLKK